MIFPLKGRTGSGETGEKIIVAYLVYVLIAGFLSWRFFVDTQWNPVACAGMGLIWPVLLAMGLVYAFFAGVEAITEEMS